MQALRVIQEVETDGCLHVKIPTGMGTRFEVIILPAPEGERPEPSCYSKSLQEGGFVKNVLASAEEDVWNDL